MRASGWNGRVIPTFRPDSVVDPDFAGFAENVVTLGEQTGEDTDTWTGYLNALRKQRQRFIALGATATDHGHPTARTANLPPEDCEQLFALVRENEGDEDDVEIFRAQMLTEMARMSVEDGLVMQIHPGSARNHNQQVFETFGRDMGADIPTPTNYVHALKPMLDVVGNEAGLTIILFTLDESTFSRELAPLAGHYPCLKLGPAVVVPRQPGGHDALSRDLRPKPLGFYNTVGFNDDTRAFLSIPAPARRGAPHRLFLSGTHGGRAQPGRRRGVCTGAGPDV